MNLARYHQPLPKRVGQFLLFANVVLLTVSTSSLLDDQPKAAAIVLLCAGIANQAVQIFVGQNPSQENEESDSNSTLSNRRDVVRKEKTAGTTPARRKKGGAK